MTFASSLYSLEKSSMGQGPPKKPETEEVRKDNLPVGLGRK